MESTGSWHDGLTLEVRQLPVAQAAALGYVYALGMTQTDAANQMNISRTEVASLLATGLRALGKHIIAHPVLLRAM